MAKTMDTMAGGESAYPEIPFRQEDHVREAALKKIGRAFQLEMDTQGNPCALKGGTALRFAMELPRPSTDLDFEGDNRVEVRKSLKRALRRAFPQEKYRIGRDWGLRGMVTIKTRPHERAQVTKVMVDYRLTGTFVGMPAETPLEKTVIRDGMRIYETRELVRRKLQTITGESPRVLPRDVYDAGWLATRHPELIHHDDRRKLKQWLEETIKNGTSSISASSGSEYGRK